jgi:hypothetical protein
VSAADLLARLQVQAWMAEAACAGMDPKLFFPKRGQTTVVEQAKAVCRVCPVRAECLDYALTVRERNGIWGGTSERQRRKIRPRGRPGSGRRGPAVTREGAAERVAS